MELSINTDECKVRQASTLEPSLGSNEEPTVVTPNRYAKDRGGENVGLREHRSNLLSPNTVCCKNGDEEDRGIKALPTVNGISEEDRMEFDGRGEASAFLR